MSSQSSPADRTARLDELLIGSRFASPHWVAETDSTNADLVQVVRGADVASVQPGARLREQVLIADFQRAGRGRRDRTWIAPPGSSLMMSVLVNTNEKAGAALDPHLAVTALALGAADACASVGVEVGLKWPNDLLVGDRKLAGILAEVPAVGLPWVVIGIGLNVHWPEGFPDEIAESATTLGIERSTESVLEPVDVVAFAAETILGFERRLAAAHAPVMEEYRQRSATLGQLVRIERVDGSKVGTATAIRDDGCLELLTETGLEVISVGDVVHLRADPS